MHLSTAIILMFIAGGLTWLNTVGTTQTLPASPGIISTVVYYGMPYAVSGYHEHKSPTPDYCYKEYFSFPYYYLRFTIDLIVALPILFVAWYVCEWLIRRSAARKAA
jgi:hypothetical protein